MNAGDESFTALYDVLRRLASRQLRRGARYTLDTTGLVHEAWLKLGVGGGGFEGRAHFLGVAASAMRHILVDHARRRGAKKRGQVVPLTTSTLSALGASSNVEELLAIDAALTKLAVLDERLARVVEWRFFAGLEEAEIASALGLDVRTVRRDWRKARAFILAELAR